MRDTAGLGDIREDPEALVECLTGCDVEELAAACSCDELRALRLLIDDVLDAQTRRPRLRVFEGGAAPDRILRSGAVGAGG